MKEELTISEQKGHIRALDPLLLQECSNIVSLDHSHGKSEDISKCSEGDLYAQVWIQSSDSPWALIVENTYS